MVYSRLSRGSVFSLQPKRSSASDYYLRGRRGFYFNPALILCQDNYDRN